ncbi:hypothetical protein ACFX13_013138 [Malus domestica]
MVQAPFFEEAESISIGEVMKSPIFSGDESSDNSHWIDLGQSPFGSDMSDQVEGAGKASLDLNRLILVMGRVAAQIKNVLVQIDHRG